MSKQGKQVNPFATAKSITPIQAVFGKAQAVKLLVTSINDNLSTSATFGYSLIDAGNNILLSGTVIMNGQDYINWPGDNNTPFTFVAGKLGVTLN